MGDRGTETAQVLAQQLPRAGHIQFCTDRHKPYTKILPIERHIQSKAHTHHIESMNNKLRHYLARLARKTHSYSKSAIALMYSLLFIWKRQFGAKLKPQVATILSKRIWEDSIAIPI